MSDIRALLGDKYEAVIEALAREAAGPTLQEGSAWWRYRKVAQSRLLDVDAILPDLLAEAWDAGWFTGAADVQIRRTPRTPNPYRAKAKP